MSVTKHTRKTAIQTKSNHGIKSASLFTMKNKNFIENIVKLRNPMNRENISHSKKNKIKKNKPQGTSSGKVLPVNELLYSIISLFD